MVYTIEQYLKVDYNCLIAYPYILYKKEVAFILNSGGALGKNHKRVMDVWMDEYKEYVYIRRPHYRNLDPGMLFN